MGQPDRERTPRGGGQKDASARGKSATGKSTNGKGASAKGGEGATPPHAPEISRLEWAAAALGLLLVLAAAGYLVYEGVSAPDGPPDVTVRADTIVPVHGGWLVRFTARNEGGSTAAGATIQGVLTDDGAREVEREHTVIDYLPRGSARRGGLVFRADPRRDRLELRLTAFEAP